MRDRTKRRGLGVVTQMAEHQIYELAESNLSPARFAEMRLAAGSSLFVAGKHPSAGWEELVGFVPENDFHYEVTVGIAVEPRAKPNLIARALISRDAEEEYCFIQWEPSQNGA